MRFIFYYILFINKQFKSKLKTIYIMKLNNLLVETNIKTTVLYSGKPGTGTTYTISGNFKNYDFLEFKNDYGARVIITPESFEDLRDVETTAFEKTSAGSNLIVTKTRYVSNTQLRVTFNGYYEMATRTFYSSAAFSFTVSGINLF